MKDHMVVILDGATRLLSRLAFCLARPGGQIPDFCRKVGVCAPNDKNLAEW